MWEFMQINKTLFSDQMHGAFIKAGAFVTINTVSTGMSQQKTSYNHIP